MSAAHLAAQARTTHAIVLHFPESDFKPDTVPIAVPKKRPRQLPHARLVAAFFALLIVVALATSITEIVMHGWMFFVLRAPGVGSTPGGD